MNFVKKLQEDCFNNAVSCEELLNLSLLIAKKINDQEMISFCNRELEGYQSDSPYFPDYRWVPVTHRIFHKEGPLDMDSIPTPVRAIFDQLYSTAPIKQSISALEMVLQRKDEVLGMHGNPSYRGKLEKFFSREVSAVDLVVERERIKGIISIVRKRITEWAGSLHPEIFAENDTPSSNINITVNGDMNNSSIAGMMHDSKITLQNKQSTK